jgi:hypothetical protein
VVPYSLTDVGSCEVACESRFCAKTWSRFTSVPTSNETCNVSVPSLPLIDFM